jgi:orotate phosphoribosyltransferase
VQESRLLRLADQALHTSPKRPEALSQLRAHVIEVVRSRGLRRFDEPVRLASGEYSQDFIDGKAALARGEDLKTACEALLEGLDELGIDFDAVGGLTMGADQFAHGLAVLAGSEWFVVRKEPKHRGTNKLIEGASLDQRSRVVLVDDVVTTGGSIQKAHHAITETGANVVAAATLVDRGDVARLYFEERSIPYFALVTYHDLGIAPVGHGLVSA